VPWHSEVTRSLGDTEGASERSERFSPDASWMSEP
jgi:hypothetical protein